MKANELMIDDWVQVPSELNRYKRLKSTFDMDEAVLYEPIPITPEILEKNGFTLKPDGWLWCEHAEIEEQNYIFIQFRKGCEEVRLVELNFVNNVQSKFERIRYIHELQHALKLCGIEKEIIL